MEDQAQKWKVDLEKNRQTDRIRVRVPLSLRKSQNQEQLDYYKNLLKAALQKNNQREIAELIDRMTKARADKTALQIEELQSIYGEVHPSALEAEIKKFYRDCYNLHSFTKNLE